MPYIKQENRDRLNNLNDGILNLLSTISIQNSGELHYLIAELIDMYLTCHGENYNTINEIIGVLTCANLEFYRRVAAPYEDSKISENGDVYT